jgi:hypothetical protein
MAITIMKELLKRPSNKNPWTGNVIFLGSYEGVDFYFNFDYSFDYFVVVGKNTVWDFRYPYDVGSTLAAERYKKLSILK